MARYLVTGSHGLLGSHLVKRLEALGHTVLRGDRKGTVPDNTDYLIDCAAWGNLHNQTTIDEIFKANFARVYDLIHNAIDKKVKGAVFTSTSAIKLPVQTTYTASKVMMEEMLKDHAEAVHLAIVRPCTIYGPNDNPTHFIPKVFDSCLKGTEMELDPSPTHDYIYIDDLVRLYLDILDSIERTKDTTYELGTGIATSNAEVVLLIEKITGKKANIVGFRQFREYDLKEWKADIPSNIKVGLEEGLTRIYGNIKSGLEKAYS